MEPFEIARQSFLSCLNAEEKAALDVSDPAVILDDVKSLEQQHHDNNVTRKLLEKASPLIRGLEHYGKALDVIANAKPGILSLLWGGIRIVLHLARSSLDIFRRLLEMLHQMSRQLEYFEIFSRLYPSSSRLRSSLVEAYTAFLDFCLATKRLLSNDLKPLKLSVSNFRDTLKPTRRLLKGEFSNAYDRLLQITDLVKEDASLAENEAAAEARVRQNAQSKFEEHRQLSAWLDPADTQANYRAAAEICEPGTRLWMFERDEYRDWASQRGNVLWVHAKPGAGKTILASTVITQLQRHYSSNNIIAYSFFDYKDAKRQSPLKMFQTLLMAMCQQSPSVLDFLNPLSRKYQEFNSSYSISLLRQMLLDSISKAKADRIFFVVDALDECNDRTELMEQIRHVMSANSRLNLFMTSREEYDLQLSLNQLPQIAISSDDVTADISLSIDHAIEKMVSSGELRFRNPSLKEVIRDSVSAKADGMFQYVKCQLETLRGAPSDKAIRAALDDLPVGLDETYIRILEQIRVKFPRDVPIVRNILFILVHSLRPLSGNELAEAAFFAVYNGYLDFEAISVDPGILLQYSGGLFRFVDKIGTIGLAHFSVKTFLLSKIIQDSSVKEFFAGDPSVIPDLTARCVLYLRLADFSHGQCFTKKQFATRVGTYHFLEYAAIQWMTHYRNLPDDQAYECDNIILEFLVQPEFTKNVLAWQQILQERVYDNYLEVTTSYDHAIAHKLDPIHHAAAHGLQRLTRMLLQNGSSLNDPGGKHGHPVLSSALSWRSYSTKTARPSWRYILELFDSGAQLLDISLIREFVMAFALNWTPDNLEALRRFLDLGIFNCPEELGTLLGEISRHPSDSRDAASLLLDRGADPNYCYTYVEGGIEVSVDRPLQLACESGNRCIAELLMKHGANLNFAETEAGTPLQAAVIGDNYVLTAWLLQKGANPNVVGGAYGTPLQAAAYLGHIDIVKILLREGVNVDEEGGYFGTPLAAAITGGKQEIIDLILEKQPNVNGGLPQTTSTHFRLDPTMRLRLYDSSLNSAPSLNPPSNLRFVYRSPINYAIQNGDLKLISRLIDLGAQLNTDATCGLMRDRSSELKIDVLRSGYHPLCTAIANKRLEMIDLILGKGADPTLGNYCAVRWAASSSMFDLFEKLLVDAKEPDVERGCLYAFFFCSDEGFALQLLEYMNRNKIELPEEHREQLLCHSVRDSSLVRLKYLLELGVKPDTSQRGAREEGYDLPFNCTPERILSYAIDHSSAAIVELLIAYDVEVNSEILHGITPFSAALRPIHMGDKTPSNIVLSLLRHGADPNQRTSGNCFPDRFCRFPLQNAVYMANFTAIDHLLEYDADIQRACAWHGTPMIHAVRTENTEMIKHLAGRGSNLCALDRYGQTLLQLAHEECLFEAVDVLASLDTLSEASPSAVQAQLQATIAQLVSQLLVSQNLKQYQEYWKLEMAAERDSHVSPSKQDRETVRLRSQWYHDSMRWITLGRCLLLGGDLENSLIALEQSTYHAYPCLKCLPLAPKCFGSDCAIRHLCKYGAQTAICKDHCLANHLDELQQLGRLDSHESIEFPRPIAANVPEGQVVLDSGERLPRETWLKSLQGWEAISADPLKSLSQYNMPIRQTPL